MKNIRIIKEDIDVSGILKQLQQYPEDWGNTLRMKGTDRQDPHTKLVTSGVLQLVMGGVTQPGEFIGDTEICVPTDATKRHTEIQKWLSTLKLKIGRCAFLKTAPGGITGKHIDKGNYYLNKDRYHLSIQGTYRYTVWDKPDLEFTKEEVVIEPGTFFWFDNKKNHMAENIGDNDRIAFIFDVPMSPNNP